MAVLFAAAAVAAVSSVIKMCDVMSSRAAAATGNRSARPLSPHQTARAGTRGTCKPDSEAWAVFIIARG